MSKTRSVLNKVLVRLFNEILLIEEISLQNQGISDLSMSEIHVIETIGIDKPRTMSEVSSDLKITLGSLTTAMNNIVKKGYADRRRIEEDRRIVLAELTDKGREVFSKHQRFHDEMIEKVVTFLSEKEEEFLVECLEKINKYFRDEYELKKNKSR